MVRGWIQKKVCKGKKKLLTLDKTYIRKVRDIPSNLFFFSHNCQIYLGIYPNAGPTCLTHLGGNHVPARLASSRQLFSHNSLKRTLFHSSDSALMRLPIQPPVDNFESLLQFVICSVLSLKNLNGRFLPYCVFLHPLPQL